MLPPWPTDRALEETDFINSLALVKISNDPAAINKLKTVIFKLNQSITEDGRSQIFPYARYDSHYSYKIENQLDVPFRPYRMNYEATITKSDRRAKNMLSTGDFQGQSLQLGEPLYYKTPIIQKPFLIMGATPTHVDFMLPAGNTNVEPQLSDYRVVNLTMDGDNYVTHFEQKTSSSKGYEVKDVTTLTHSVASQVTAEASVSVGPAKGSFKATAGAGYVNEKTADEANQNTSTYSTDLALTAGNQDRIGVLSQSKEYFIYPVLGGSVCPEGDACDDSEKGQQYVMYTRQSEMSRAYVDGGQVAWYQPVHEVNNVLSYPRSFTQLEAGYGNPIMALSQVDNTFYTSTGSSSFKMAWLNGTTSSTKTTLINKGTWNAGFSGSYGTSGSFSKLTGVGYTNSFDVKYEGSVTSSGVITDTSNYEAGSSVTVALPNSFRSPTEYGYPITPVVFGDKLDSSDIVTTDPFMPEVVKEAIAGSETGALAGGYMKLGYYVDFRNLPSNYMGTWWRSKEGFSSIDIGLNNPTRWDTTNFSTISLDDDGLNCLTRFVCTMPYQPTVSGRENFSPFYNMRGLFVTPQGGGETRFEAEEGEKLSLQVRIYNYSLRDMPAGSRVHVQFYRQSVASSGYLAPDSAQLIDETWLSEIPSASYSSVSMDNWKMAKVNWDTTNAQGRYHFWVVAWAEDSNGNMIAEQPGKGLSDTHTSPLFRDISEVPLQYVTLDSPDLGEVSMTFTNNVGMYPQEFNVLPKGIPVVAATSAVSRVTTLGDIVDDITLVNAIPVNPIMITVNNQDETSVNLGLSTQYDTQSQLIYITDSEDNIIGMQRVGRIFKHKNVNVPFTVDQCGDNTLNIRIGSPNRDAIASQYFSTYVQCH
ncbi:hypothetical protein [Shewanella surugensis]|uniref:Uncharacterized protein n=1 Tax=Shewanella surugensis TaxID=212020 RepID=A0ABT0LJG8_9GAMM|nr:hypothetical protein [Shewanella surugensis]MCL1127858.1 hypothetical protein [Shewanella surugensis]